MMKYLCVAAMLLVLTSAGCEHNTSPSMGLGDPYLSPYNDPQITLLSPDLQRWLAFQSARIESDGNKPMQVEVPVRNLTNRNYPIDYRFTFFNRQGMQLKPTMQWRFANLAPKQVVSLSAGAMSAEAVSYRLEVKWAE